MKYETDLKFGQSMYLINDVEQDEYRLNRIIIGQKGVISFELFSPDGEVIEVLELHTAREKNILKSLEGDKNDKED
jgi:hypothetical protein